MPALREVPEHISGLANHFLNKYCQVIQTDRKQFAPAASQRLQSYIWLGNARQSENEVKRLVASVRGKSITEDHLDASIRSVEAPVQNLQANEHIADFRFLPAVVEALERRIIGDALKESWGEQNKQKAAQALGLSRQGLIKKLKRLGIV